VEIVVTTAVRTAWMNGVIAAWSSNPNGRSLKHRPVSVGSGHWVLELEQVGEEGSVLTIDHMLDGFGVVLGEVNDSRFLLSEGVSNGSVEEFAS
jgi:hypothetical protein